MENRETQSQLPWALELVRVKGKKRLAVPGKYRCLAPATTSSAVLAYYLTRLVMLVLSVLLLL